MTEIKANFPKRNTEITVLATDGKTDISADFLLAYSVLELSQAKRDAVMRTVDALHDAEYRHPEFPFAECEMLAIIAEEVGEAFKAFNDGNLADMETEITHIMATCIRTLEKVKFK